jgi:Na+-driven multidrug efflux pump
MSTEAKSPLMPGLQTLGPPPTIRQLLSLWLPLAASVVMMVLEPSIINVGLGRTHLPELALAAYGIASGMALLVEAPIMMLLDASVAWTTDRQVFALLRRFTLGLGLLVTASGLLVSVTPFYGLLVVDWMNIPPDVAAQARPTLAILAFWPLPIAWRRTHQGVLIRTGQTTIITIATGIRLVVLAVAMYGGLLLFPQAGAVVAGLAMDLSVVVEAVVITWATGQVLRSGELPETTPKDENPPQTLRALWRAYSPLATSSILRQTSRPLLNAGIAAALLPRASLAAWPVTWSLAMLLAGPAWSVQQLTTALAKNEASYRTVRNFGLALSALLSLALAAMAFTPLYPRIMGGIFNLSPELQELAQPATQILAVFPLLMGAQSILRGLLIRAGWTAQVRTAMWINVSFLAATLLVGALWGSMTGVMLAAVASLTGGVAELAWLSWRARY